MESISKYYNRRVEGMGQAEPGTGTRQKVLLYNPSAVFFDMPLALLAVGSALDSETYEVLIIDSRLDPDAHQQVLAQLPDALCIGMTVLTGSPLRDALDLAEKIKRRRPDFPVIWGGWHPSLFPEETLRDESSIDITVQGQGELTFRRLVDALSRGTSLTEIPGITFRNAGSIQRNPGAPLLDMDQLPAARYDLIPVDSYLGRKKRRQLDYISSIGCRFRCSFCADPFVYQRGWKAISPSQMMQQLSHLVRLHRIEDINFQDETFFTSQRRVREIAKKMACLEPRVTWAATMRADQGARLSEGDFRELASCGLRRVLIGVESGSQKMLDWMKKDIRLEQVQLCAERCRDNGIGVIFPFIVGFPDEPLASILQSLQLASQLRRMDPQFTTPIFFFKPYPGSEISQFVQDQGYALPRDTREWADFDYIGSCGPWVDPSVRRLVDNFRFYNRLEGGVRGLWFEPLRKLARWRIDHRSYGFPVEKLIDKIRPQADLS